MAEDINLDEALADLRELLHKYNDFAKEILDHHNTIETHHHSHELRAQLEHLKYMLDEDGNEKSERKDHFLKEHLEAINHVKNHMQHFRLHMGHEAFEAAEQRALIEALKNAYLELKELYDKLREQKDLQEYFKHHAHVRPSAAFYPSSSENQE